MTATSYVKDLLGGLLNFQRQAASLSHIADVNEISTLFAILVYERWIIVEQSGGENCQHARVRIGKRLARAEDVEKTERESRDPVGASYRQAETFLMIFANGIDGRERGTFRLRRCYWY